MDNQENKEEAVIMSNTRTNSIPKPDEEIMMAMVDHIVPQMLEIINSNYDYETNSRNEYETTLYFILCYVVVAHGRLCGQAATGTDTIMVINDVVNWLIEQANSLNTLRGSMQ